MIRALLRYDKQIAAARHSANKGDFQSAIRRFNEAMAAKPTYLVNSDSVQQLHALLMAQNRPVEVTLQSDHETWVNIVGVKAPQRFGLQTVMILPGNYEVIGRRAGYRDVVVPLKVRQGASLPLVKVVSREVVGSGPQPNAGASSFVGKEAPKDSTETAKLLRSSAERGDAGSQLLLGIRFANGDGVPKDSAEAAMWFRRAAQQGNTDAQFRFGVMLGKGDGVSKNSTESAQWCRLAADRGHSEAQIALGNMYRTGVGAPKDLDRQTGPCAYASGKTIDIGRESKLCRESKHHDP